MPFANPLGKYFGNINVNTWIEDFKMFFCLFPFLVSLAGARLGAADDCSWKPEGAPKHVLFWGRVVGLEIVPEIQVLLCCLWKCFLFLMYKAVY